MALALRAVLALTSVTSGALHWDLWANHGYERSPVGDSFIAQAVVAVVAGLLALAPRRILAAPATIVAALSLVAFVLSRTVGLPTLDGTFTESGAEPRSASILGVRTTLLIVASEGIALAAGVALLGGADRLVGAAARGRGPARARRGAAA